MEQTTLKDVFISQGELERYFDKFVPVHLWRGLNMKKNSALFDLVEKPFKMSNGNIRRPDVTIEDGWVKIKHAPRGISTFDRSGVPEGKDWVHYRIPCGTALPDGLAIIKDSFNTSLKPFHYTIAPAYDMPLAIFKVLLNQFAKNAVREVA